MKISFVSAGREQSSEISPGKIDLTTDYPESAMVEFDFVMILDDERPTKPQPDEVWMELTIRYQRQSDKTWKRNPIIGERGSGDVRDVHDMKWDRYDSDTQDKYVALVDALFEPDWNMNKILEKFRKDALTAKIAGLENQISNLKRIM